MIHLPKQVEYALMVLAEMQHGKPGQLFSVRALTEQLAIPFDVTGKAMQAMTHADILRSMQGKYGGYQIIRDLRHVSLEELIRTVVGPSAIATCLQPGHVCPHSGRCTIRKAVGRLDVKMREFLGAISVQDLIN